jgi:hypothetical protein
MKRRKEMKQKRGRTLWYVGLIATLALAVLAGCGGNDEQASSAQSGTGGSQSYASEVLSTSYPDALDVSAQLALGTMQLEETDQAVTPEQATALLPLWQALRGGVTNQVEVDAVLKQIEGTMDQEQLQAIAGMQLTQESLKSWMEEQGTGAVFPGGFGAFGDMSEEERAALQATAEAGGGFPGGFAGSGDMSDEERAALRETAQAGGGFRGGGQGFGDMSEEQRAALQATMEAGGGSPGGFGAFGDMSDEERAALRETAQAGGGFAGGRRGAVGGSTTSLVEPLIQLLQARASGT